MSITNKFPFSFPTNYSIIKQKYLPANDCHLTVYGSHFKCKDNVLLLSIELATVRLKEPNIVRLVTNSKTGEHWLVDKSNNEEPYLTYMGGFLSNVDLALSSPEGSEFYGWRRIKQYRLTKEEIMALVHTKLYLFDFFKRLRIN